MTTRSLQALKAELLADEDVRVAYDELAPVYGGVRAMTQPGLPMLVEFTVPGEVRGKGRPRFDGRRGRTYTDAKTAAYEQTVQTMARLAMAGAAPVDGPVRLLVTAYIEVPRSYSARKRQYCLLGRTFPTKKPDFDNCEKIIADALKGVVYIDDAQVVQWAGRKVWAPEGKLHVMVDRVQSTAERGGHNVVVQ
jgi:Holliday junction resolvase RusA-like endonuclease